MSSYLTGPVSFVRFRPDLPRPRLFDESHLEKLRDHQAGRQRVASADGVEVGWAAGDHVLDTDFTLEKQVWPDHLLFDLRTDTNKPPPELFKAYYAVEIKALTKNNPSGFPSARQKREAKEAARERLEHEAKDGRFLKRKCTPALWDQARNEVFFASTSTANHERFLKLFTQTFGGLTPITAGELAVRLNPAATDERLSGFVRGSTPEGDGPAWCPDDTRPDFLGNEFLLWLWYYADVESDTLKLPDGGDVVVFLSGGLKLDDPRAQTGSATINNRHGGAARLPESRTAVREAKLPRKAALTLVRHDEQFAFVLQAETLAVTGCKLPAPPEDATGRAVSEHRLQMVSSLAGTIDDLFGAFLARRMSSYWAADLQGMQGWLRQGGLSRRASA